MKIITSDRWDLMKIIVRSKSAIFRLLLLLVLPVLLLIVCGEANFVSGQYPDFEAIDPYPSVGKTDELCKINFTGFSQADQWQALHNVELKQTPDGLFCRGTEDDPYFQSPALPEEISQKLVGPILVNISARTDNLKSFEIFWSEKGKGGYHPDRSSRTTKVIRNNQWQNCLVEIDAKAPITRLRIDPGSKGQSAEIRSITFCRINLPVMQIIGWNTNNGTLSLDLKNNADKIGHWKIRVAGKVFPLEIKPGEIKPFTLDFPKKKMFETLDVLLTDTADNEQIVRSFYTWNRQIKQKDLLTLGDKDLTAQFAPDGSGALILRNGQCCAVVTPLVFDEEGYGRILFDRSDPFGTPAKITSPAPIKMTLLDGDANSGSKNRSLAFQFKSEGNQPVTGKIEFQLEKDRLAFRLNSDRSVHGPVLRPIGSMRQALLSGVEYLEEGEFSSSVADIETYERFRYAPPTTWMTAPLAIVVTDNASFVMNYDNPNAQPIFAVPDFIDRMTLDPLNGKNPRKIITNDPIVLEKIDALKKAGNVKGDSDKPGNDKPGNDKSDKDKLTNDKSDKDKSGKDNVSGGKDSDVRKNNPASLAGDAPWTLSHRLGLYGEKFNGAFVIGAPEVMETLILKETQKRGLPKLPTPVRSQVDQNKLNLAGFLKSTLRTSEGKWVHATAGEAGLGPFRPNYSSDFCSVIYELTGKLPEVPRLERGGGHISILSSWFLRGDSQVILDSLNSQAKGTVKNQRPDGSFGYSGKYLKGHWSDTASGHTANSLFFLGWHWSLTGNENSLKALLKGCDYLNTLKAPRGAQVWELSLHTPDVMGASRALMANTFAWQATKDQKYLDAARRWAASGLPFVYLWDLDLPPTDHFISCRYATIAVFGATSWKAPNWMGRPVQWCGLDYAHALLRFAPCDQSLDWRKIAEGIVLSGQQQQYREGNSIGLLPDSISMADQVRFSYDINPSALHLLHRMARNQFTNVDVKITEKGNRIVAPFPITIKNETVFIKAKNGVKYDVWVNNKVQKIVSRGTDQLELGN